MKKVVVGLSLFDRVDMVFEFLNHMLTVLFVHSPEGITKLGTRCHESANKIHAALAPHPDLVKEYVNQKPYSPFGVDGLTDTTKYDGKGNTLADAYSNFCICKGGEWKTECPEHGDAAKLIMEDRLGKANQLMGETNGAVHVTAQEGAEPS